VGEHDRTLKMAQTGRLAVDYVEIAAASDWLLRVEQFLNKGLLPEFYETKVADL
jgi:hypothetical protein